MAFRVDASLEIGSGHVVRCLTLARVLRRAGVKCHFICRDHPGNLIAKIDADGFSVRVLPRVELAVENLPLGYQRWLGAALEVDANQTASELKGISPRWLVVDHYGIGQKWQDITYGLYEKLFVIDDLADRPLRADLLLNQNFGSDAKEYATLVPEECQFAIGTQYSLLRPEFADLREHSLARRASATFRHLVLTMGGVDRVNATSHVLRSLEKCTLPSDLLVSVVVGSACPWIEQIQLIAADLSVQTRILVDVADMAQLMVSADFAIGAAGGTTWEFCSLGLPFAMLAIADNQISTVDRLGEAGVALALGRIDGLEDALPLAMNKVSNPQFLHDLGMRAAAITDGNGVFRVSGLMGF